MKSLNHILEKLCNWYKPDLRALALMRIAIAIVVICDLIIRAGDLHAHYTNEGLWPTDLIYHSGWKEGYWSLHALSGGAGLQYILFALHFVFAFFLLFGFRARLSSFVLLVLSISLHNRNIYILQAGDDLLRLCLLWGCFLPWSAKYALDPKRSASFSTLRFAGLGYYLMLASVYIFTVLMKTGKDWHEDNSAIYYALSLRQLCLPFGKAIYHFPVLLKIMTIVVYYIEILIPILILIPTSRGHFRNIAFILILLLHLGIGSTLYVGLFFIISICASLGMLSSRFLDRFNLLGSDPTIETQEYSKPKFAGEIVLVLLIVLNIAINLMSLKNFPFELSRPTAFVAHALRLDQYWAMFSPDVLRKDGWFVYHGIDEVGRQWDLRHNQDYVIYKEPKNVVATYKTDRWRKLAENMQDTRFTFLRPLYCNYIFKQWNKYHPRKKMKVLNLYFMEVENLPDYKSTEPVKQLYSVCNGQ